MRLHSYVVARDFGFAPNPFFGVCTLATCKPRIRGIAKIGDWVLGTGSKVRSREGHVVFAMQVSEAMSFDDYWNDPRFLDKRPYLRGSKKQAFGDNIYHKDRLATGWCQIDSHHSQADGSPNPHNIANDTQTDRVLIGQDYVYWGGTGPLIPKRFRNYRGHDICCVRNHKNKFPESMVLDFLEWLHSVDQKGYCGAPLDWTRSP